MSKNNHNEKHIILFQKYLIPDKYIIKKFSHSHGHGGQNINKTSTKVQLRLDIGKLKYLHLPDDIFEKLKIYFSHGHANAECQKTRHRNINLEIAYKKLQNQLEDAILSIKYFIPVFCS